MADSRDMGAALALLLERRGLGAAGVAESAGLDPERVGRYLNGAATPRGSTLGRLLAAIGADDEELTAAAGEMAAGREGAITAEAEEEVREPRTLYGVDFDDLLDRLGELSRRAIAETERRRGRRGGPGPVPPGSGPGKGRSPAESGDHDDGAGGTR